MKTKDKVLDLLTNSKDLPLSGEAIGETLGVSRAAVWKAIKTLREDGYKIEAGTNKGYYLSTENQIDVEMIKEIAGISSVEFYQSIDSTNIRANQIASVSETYTTIISDEQTAGRGRIGRKFHSPSGTGVYMSIIVKPEDIKIDSGLLTVVGAVALSKSIEKVCNKSTKIKWVNDVFVNEKKVGGILTEGVTDIEAGRISHIIIGLGINCFPNQFPDYAASIAGPIGENSSDFSRSQLAGQVIKEVKNLTSGTPEDLITYYRNNSMVLGKRVLVMPSHKLPPSPLTSHQQKDAIKQGIARPALAIDIDLCGGLIVKYEDNDEMQTLTSGEISIRFMED